MDPNAFSENLKRLNQLALELKQEWAGLSAAEALRLASDLRQVLATLGAVPLPPGAGPANRRLAWDPVDTERLAAENVRHKALLDSIFAADPSGLAVVSEPELRFVYSNPVYRFLCPKPELPLIDQPYRAVWEGEPEAGYAAQIEAVIQSGRPFQTSGFRRDFPDGSTRTFTFQTRRFYWDEHPAALVILWDTTPLSQVQAALEAARVDAVNEKNLLEAVLEALPVGLAIADAQGGTLRANKAYDKIWGGPRPLPQSVADYSAYQAWWVETGHPVQPEEWASAQAVQTGKPVIGQVLRIRRFDGTHAFVHNSAAPLFDAGGQVIGCAVAIQNISSNVQAEEALRDQVTLLQNLNDAVIAFDADFNITAWNAAAEALYGWKAAEVLGRGELEVLQTVFPEHDRETLLRRTAEVGHWRGQVTQVNKNGQRFPVQVHSIALRDDAGKVCGQFNVNRGLSDPLRPQPGALQDEARIEVQRRLIEQREQERQQIARDLHDGPIQELTAATMTLYELVEKAGSPELAGELAGLRESLQRQIAELRAFTGELRPPALQNFGLGRALQSHAARFQEKHPELTVRVEINQNGGALPEPAKIALYRVYQEALTNVVKHAAASTVLVRYVRNANQAVLEIEDDGRGFTLTTEWLELARQGHLGFVGMRERMDAIGGALEIRAEPGQGAHIRVTVPLNRLSHDQ